jgi:dihydrofolate reductase
MNKTEIIIIAALAESNRVIGKDGKLPWRIPEDSARFKHLTLGHAVVMGRKTWEYDIEKCPLIHRYNIIISTSPDDHEIAEDCPEYPYGLAFVNSLPEALKKAETATKVFIVGGASIYAQALEVADTLELTLIEGTYEGDTFFPDYAHLIGSQFGLVNQEIRLGYRFETYKRISVMAANSSPAVIPALQTVI